MFLFVLLLVKVLFIKGKVCLRAFLVDDDILSFLFCFSETGSCIAQTSTTHDVARDVLELLLIYWDHRPMPPLLVSSFCKLCALLLRFAFPDFRFLACLLFQTINVCWRSRGECCTLSRFSYSIHKHSAFSSYLGMMGQCVSRAESKGHGP